MVMGSHSKLLSTQPQKRERYSHGYDKHSQILELSQPTVAHQALLLVLRVCTRSWGLQTHITLLLEKVFASIAVVPQQRGLLMLVCFSWSHLGVFLSFLLSPQESITSGLLFSASSVSQADSSLVLLSHFPSTEISLFLWETTFLQPPPVFSHFNIPYWHLNSIFQRQCSFQIVPFPLILQLS